MTLFHAVPRPQQETPRGRGLRVFYFAPAGVNPPWPAPHLATYNRGTHHELRP
jgi:hypothetical protein